MVQYVKNKIKYSLYAIRTEYIIITICYKSEAPSLHLFRFFVIGHLTIHFLGAYYNE